MKHAFKRIKPWSISNTDCLSCFSVFLIIFCEVIFGLSS